jgi:hypothetical protein
MRLVILMSQMKSLKFMVMPPPSKAEGTIQLMYENMNGLCNQISNNEKLEKARALHDELEVDIAGYCEHQLNMAHKENCN